MGDKVGENPAALRAAVLLLSAKNRRGVFKHPPPPSRAKVKGKVSAFYKIWYFIEAAHAVKSVQTPFKISL